MKTMLTDVTKAFPYEESYNHSGMDLRDYFAAKYLSGIMANPEIDFATTYKRLAEIAYMVADAMMEARK